jgi:ppGpp synthetase/RelA/SpoT-type nucleotidyltranferase
LKTAESFYVKAQSRRWGAVNEDIFACTIVVENASQIQEVVKLLESFFRVCYRRPKIQGITCKQPELFVFDDLRLYLRLKERDSNLEISDLIFECQVKTFLQHAWSIATHDLIYKPKELLAWANARVAYQVKAMLEHAEVAISAIDSISKSELLSQTTKVHKARLRIYNDLKEYKVDLGENINRVLDNIIELLANWDYDWNQVWEWIKEDSNKGDGYGLSQLRFSVYEIIISAILYHDKDSIMKYEEYLHWHPDKKILVPEELLEKHPELRAIGKNVG